MTGQRFTDRKNRAYDAIDWDQANCAGVGQSLFFADGEGKIGIRQLTKAKAVCAKCPIQLECRAYGTEHETFGIWGGILVNSRAVRDMYAHMQWLLARREFQCPQCHSTIPAGGRYRYDPKTSVVLCEGCTT